MWEKLTQQRSDPKYRVPQPHRLDIERPRLLERLHATTGKVIALIAPSGYGKTTLAAQLARACQHSVAWLSLSPDEAEPVTLIRSLAAAVALSNLRLPHWERAGHYPASPERHAAALASDLNASSHQFLLVLDALDHLSPDSSRSLAVFLRQLGPHHRVVLAGYEEPEDCLNHLPTTEVRLLGPTELAFTPPESRAFLERAGHELELSIDPQLAHSRVAGWPAALAMLAHGAPATWTSPERLVRSLVEQLPAEVRTALPEVAVLAVWSTEWANAVGCRLPPRWLCQVRRSGLPLIPLDHDAYRPHQLVVDRLEQLLRQDPPRHRQLHQAAARLAESRGLPLLALKHLRIAGDRAEAVRLAGEIVPAWARRSQWKLVRRALDGLALTALPPTLRVSLGIALLETGDPARGENILAQHRKGPAAAWSYFGLALAAYRRGALKQALALTRDGLEQAADERAMVQLLRTRAAVLGSLGRLEEAAEDARECVAHAERLADPQLLVQALSIQQFTLERSGQNEQALAIADRAIALARLGGTLHKALPTVDSLFNYYFRHNRAKEISWLVLELLEEARAAYPLAVPWMLRNLGYNWLQTGVIAAALPQFNEAATLFQTNGDLDSAGHTLSEVIYCLLRLGRLQEAEALLPRLQELLQNSDSKDSATTRSYTEGLVCVYQGRRAEARKLLELGRDQAEQSYPTLDELRATAYLAEVARLQYRLQRHHLAELMALLDRYGSDWFLSLEAEPLDALYRACIAQDWFAERLRPHLEATSQPVAAQPVLELRTLGKFGATVNGKPLELLPKERELLTYLALHGPVHRTSIIDALWPELDLDTGRHALNTHLYRLRAALSVVLGPDYGRPVQFDRANARYRLISKLSVHLDTAALEAKAAQSDSKGNAAGRHEAFLEGCEADWVITRRRYYQSLAERLPSD